MSGKAMTGSIKSGSVHVQHVQHVAAIVTILLEQRYLEARINYEYTAI